MIDTLFPVNLSPGQLDWRPDGFALSAGPGTDLFANPDGSPPIDNAGGLRLVLGNGPVLVSARVTPDFAATFDAGAMIVRTSSGAWAKLAYERAPDGRPTVVTVVTKDTSDDANGPDFDAPSRHLRVYWDGRQFAFHHSADGRHWSLARLFALPRSSGPPTLDFIAQSPTGAGCTVLFDRLSVVAAGLSDLRDSS